MCYLLGKRFFVQISKLPHHRPHGVAVALPYSLDFKRAPLDARKEACTWPPGLRAELLPRLVRLSRSMCSRVCGALSVCSCSCSFSRALVLAAWLVR